MAKVLINNSYIFTGDQNNTIIPRGCIVIEQGRIVAVTSGEFIDPSNFDLVIDGTNTLTMPGLINAHHHSYANLVKGMNPTVPLEQWMLYTMALGGLLTPEDMYWNALAGAMEMLRSGTTSCMDHLAQGFEALDGAMQAYRDIGLRVTMAPMISDKPYHATLPIAEDALPPELKNQGAPTAQELVATTVALYEKWHTKGSRLHVAFGPSGPQRCTDDLLKECGNQARLLDTAIHTHVLESKAQARTAEFLYGKPMLFHLDEMGCLSERTSLVHSVWINDREMKLAADRGAVVVHNPSSNLLIGSGIAPVIKCREMGVPVALGTDGANVSGSLSMFDSMKLAGLIHNRPDLPQEAWLQPQDVLDMITRHAPKVLLEKDLGRIAPGQKADLVLLNLENPSLTPLNNACWQLVYAEPTSAVETVLVQGEPVLLQGKLMRISEKRILEEAARRGERIRKAFAEKHHDQVLRKAAMIRKACSF